MELEMLASLFLTFISPSNRKVLSSEMASKPGDMEQAEVIQYQPALVSG